MKKYVIIVAGGKGERMNAGIPKQFLLLKGKPILMHTIEAFLNYDQAIKIVLVLPESQLDYWNQLCDSFLFKTPVTLAKGGASRFESVKNGLSQIPNEGLVAIHDGVRPLVSLQTIKTCFENANIHASAIPVVDMIDSIRQIEGDKNFSVNRDMYKLIQTPQVFDLAKLKSAYEKASKSTTQTFTDDASVFEFASHEIFLVQGNRENIKITSPMDLLIAETILNNNQ